MLRVRSTHVAPLLLWLVGCAPEPSPHAALEALVGTTDAARVPQRSVWMALLPDGLHAGTVGPWWTDESGQVPHPLATVATQELDDGKLPSEAMDGLTVPPILHQLTETAERLTERAATDPTLDFNGELWLLVDRQASDRTMSTTMFCAGQAGYDALQIFGVGDAPDAPPPDPMPGHQALPTPWSRPHPLSPVRVGEVDGHPAFTIDDRPAGFAVDVPGGDASLALPGEGLVDRLLAEPSNPPVYASYADAATHARYPVLPSFEMLLHVAKDADDRMLVAATRGTEAQRQRWVEDAARTARDAGRVQAADFLETAAALGRGEAPDHARAFLDDAIRSHPVGVHSEADDLARSFQRDRWLMQPIQHPGLAAELTEQLTNDPFLAAEAKRQALWTNPPDPTQRLLTTETPTYLVRSARSHETTLINALGGTARVPDLMDAYVAAIRDGTVDLTPRHDSGLYDRQHWALEPLLTLPDTKVQPDATYRKRLEHAFRSAVAMRRETAVKGLFLPNIGASVAHGVQVSVAPALRLEPLPSVYARHAELYRWADRLADGQPEPVAELVHAETHRLAELFAAAAALSRADLGGTTLDGAAPTPEDAAPEEPPGFGKAAAPSPDDPPAHAELEEPWSVDVPPVAADVDVAPTESWLEGWRDDPLLGEDVRVFVPVGRTDDGGVVGWALLGIRHIDLVVRYTRPPEVRFRPGLTGEVTLLEARYTLLVPVFTEVQTRRMWDREALRGVADQHSRALAIQAALEAG